MSRDPSRAPRREHAPAPSRHLNWLQSRSRDNNFDATISRPLPDNQNAISYSHRIQSAHQTALTQHFQARKPRISESQLKANRDTSFVDDQAKRYAAELALIRAEFDRIAPESHQAARTTPANNTSGKRIFDDSADNDGADDSEGDSDKEADDETSLESRAASSPKRIQSSGPVSEAEEEPTKRSRSASASSDREPIRRSTRLRKQNRRANYAIPAADFDEESAPDSDFEPVVAEKSDMGVIRKKAASRGNEGGTKYHCDVCSVDITSTVRISCAACPEFDLCVPCFADGKSTKAHDPATHSYSVIEQNSVPIYTEDWGADEELLLLEGAEIYGLGSWADIADHVGGYRSKEEVRDHYIDTYIKSPNFPLPERADPKDKRLQEAISKEEFQTARKKRIEDKKEAAKSAPPTTPKKAVVQSHPACHEVSGFMPGRLEFDVEYWNDAEEAVQSMQFDPGSGFNANGEMEPDVELKKNVMDIYNSRLTARTERKKIIFEHNLLDYRKNVAQDKKLTKEERDLLNKAKPFARMMNHKDFEAFTKGLLDEHNLRIAIVQLKEWRSMGIGDIKSGEKYEQEKQQRIQRAAPQGQFDRLASSMRPSKQQPQHEGPTAASLLVASELPTHLQQPPTPLGSSKAQQAASAPDMNGTTLKKEATVQPLPGVIPWNLTDEGAPDLHLLPKEEVELCNVLHVRPKPYLLIKQAIMDESVKNGGTIKRKDIKGICKLDSGKSNRLFDFFVQAGWIGKG